MKKNPIKQTLFFLYSLLLGSLLLPASTVSAQHAPAIFLSNEAYRQRVEAYNQPLQQQRLQTEISRRNRKIAHSNYLPKLDLQGEGTLNLSKLKAWHEPLGQYRNHTYQGILHLSQPLYSGGRLSARYKASQTHERISQWRLKESIEELHYQSDVLYWNASACHALLQAAQQYRDIVQRQYALIQERFSNGKVSRTDLLMITTRLKEAELQFIQARENRTLAFQQLNLAMGEAPEAPIDSLSPIDSRSTFNSRASVDGRSPIDSLSPIDADVLLATPCTLAEVLQRKPDYQASLLQVALSQQQRKEILSQYRPKVNLFFSGGWATATPNLGYDVSFNPIVGLQINLPLFRGGARTQTNRNQKANIALQKLQQSWVSDHIQSELAAARTQVIESRAQTLTAQENMKVADENLQLITFSYREGRASLIDVMTVQLAWTQAYKNLIHTQLAEKLASSAYKKATCQ